MNFRVWIAKKILGERYFVAHRLTTRHVMQERLDTINFVARSLINEVEL